MPRYMYKCESCGQHTEATHSIMTKYEVCSQLSQEDCEGALTRIPSFSRYIKTVKRGASEPTGKATRDAIEQARVELKEQKKHLKKQEYDD
jgi:sRNA-binding protein